MFPVSGDEILIYHLNVPVRHSRRLSSMRGIWNLMGSGMYRSL
jgi:hypothetical protein